MEIKQTIISLLQMNNICIEYTLLGKKGEFIINYNKTLFTVVCVNGWVGKSANNLIINNIEWIILSNISW